MYVSLSKHRPRELTLCWFQDLNFDLIMLNLSLKIHSLQPEDYPLILHENWEAFPNKFLCMKLAYELYCDTMDTHIVKEGVLLSQSKLFLFYSWWFFFKFSFLSGIHFDTKEMWKKRSG